MADDKDREMMARYKRRLDNAFDEKNAEEQYTSAVKQTSSIEYNQFVRENQPEVFSIYEKACEKAAGLLHIKPGEKRTKVLLKAIDESHLNVTPEGVTSLSYLVPLMT